MNYFVFPCAHEKILRKIAIIRPVHSCQRILQADWLSVIISIVKMSEELKSSRLYNYRLQPYRYASVLYNSNKNERIKYYYCCSLINSFDLGIIDWLQLQPLLQ